MLRLTEIKLPLAHADNALQAALLHTLEITPADLESFTVFKRSFYARKAVITQVYIVDVVLASATLGPATYSQVIRVDNRPAPGTAPLGRSTRRLYYARGKGVVAFEEAGNDLWYRLP